VNRRHEVRRETVKALVTLGLSALVALVTGPASVTASASTDRTQSTSIACRAPVNGRFPTITRLRATHTGCTTARAVAEGIQAGWQANGALPASFDIYAGAPVFRCRYQVHRRAENPYKTASCISGRKLVTMILGS
jgi:hypothetical protein